MIKKYKNKNWNWEKLKTILTEEQKQDLIENGPKRGYPYYERLWKLSKHHVTGLFILHGVELDKFSTNKRKSIAIGINDKRSF